MSNVQQEATNAFVPAYKKAKNDWDIAPITKTVDADLADNELDFDRAVEGHKAKHKWDLGVPWSQMSHGERQGRRSEMRNNSLRNR